MKLYRIAKYAWFVLLFNLGVIMWGAYVRATGAGAGCGRHWPLCNGEVIPRTEQVETLVEFSHRLSSGTAFLLVLGLLIWAWRVYPKGHRVRTAAVLSMVFMVTEALVGAGLVLFELVAEDTSTARAFSISIHLVNTFILLACITLTAWWASGGERMQMNWRGAAAWVLLAGLIGVLILGMSGALTALGDTLFPVSSVGEGLQQDFSPTAHFLIRLRVLHPTIAIVMSAYWIIAISGISSRIRTSRNRQIGWLVISLLVTQLLAGVINVLLLAPVWMQMLHLLISDSIWIGLILYTAATNSLQEISYAPG